MDKAKKAKYAYALLKDDERESTGWHSPPSAGIPIFKTLVRAGYMRCKSSGFVVDSEGVKRFEFDEEYSGNPDWQDTRGKTIHDLLPPGK